MADMELSATINADIALVFQYVADVEAHTYWTNLTGVEKLYEGEIAEGSQWRSTGTSASMDMSDVTTVTVLEAPYHFAFRTLSVGPMGTVTVGWSYHLEKAPEGTKLTLKRHGIQFESLKFPVNLLMAIPGVKPALMRYNIKFATQETQGTLDKMRQYIEHQATA